ncbi:MAG: DUF1549 domain-containing protein [Pirellulaceae bacterium]|nr:DUF1549 domain-containing protein [Pirellulaceae bacterium]MDP7018892.1 DUF1549 domain-containing protein [Pirellulaceae bacterium]
MNEEHRDPLIDSLMEEVVGETSPPDLTSRILAALESDRLRAASAPPVPPPVAAPPHSPIAAASSNGCPSTTRRKRNRWLSPVLTVASVVAVGVTVGLVAIQLNPDDDNKVAGGGPESSTTRSPQDRSEKPAPGPDVEKRSTDSPGVQSGVAENPKRDGGPSAFDDEPPFGKPPRDGVSPPAQLVRKPERMDESQIIEQVDDLLAVAWSDNDVKPAAIAADSEYCRRLFLALLGRIPTADELTRFVDDQRPEKRSSLVVELQESSEYADEYALNESVYWTNVLIGRTGGLRRNDLANRDGLQQYLRDAWRDDAPYDEVVTELLTATGSGRAGAEDFNGAVNFLLDGMMKDGALATARTARVFLGKQLQCVQCHNHPTNETWAQNQFWEMNAFFRQMVARRSDDGQVRLTNADYVGASGDIDEAELYYDGLDGVKKVAYPVFLDGRRAATSGDLAVVDRRRELASFVTSSPDLSRAVVNRLWGRFLLYGFTQSVDDMGAHATVSHPELLDHLSEQLVAYDYDLKKLTRWVISSAAFQRSSQVSADALADAPDAGSVPLFSRYYTRQLPPEAVYDSLTLAADTRSKNSRTSGVRGQRLFLNQFSENMGTDEGDETDLFTGDIRQSVMLMTSPVMQEAINGAQGTVLHRVTTSGLSIDEKISHLFLSALSRKPTARELIAVRRIVEANKGDVKGGLQDVWWALLNSNEFILDH